MTESCPICMLELYSEREYVKINNPGENSLMHRKCLTDWLMFSHNGIMTQDSISSYILYRDGQVMKIVDCAVEPDEEDKPESDDEMMYYIYRINHENQRDYRTNNCCGIM